MKTILHQLIRDNIIKHIFNKSYHSFKTCESKSIIIYRFTHPKKSLPLPEPSNNVFLAEITSFSIAAISVFPMKCCKCSVFNPIVFILYCFINESANIHKKNKITSFKNYPTLGYSIQLSCKYTGKPPSNN